uniref:Uncharacterized protein n=1 Tax=Anopheles farauti TaxID=69004 RepID=A0A182Q9C3_9DIPT
MKLPKWIRRTPKSNVGVKSIVKTSGHSSDSGGGAGGGHRHRRKTSSGSVKGKRKRNSYVSSAITTKNFYPAEHFFKTGPPPPALDGRVDETERMARYRTLPASFGGVHYQQGAQPFYYGPLPGQRQQQAHPLGLPPVRNNNIANVRYAGSADHLHHEVPYNAPNNMQSAQHNGAATLHHDRSTTTMLSVFPPHSTNAEQRRRSYTPTGYQQHFSYDNGFVTKAYQQSQMHSIPQPPPPPPPPLPQGYVGVSDTVNRTRTRQILPTSTPGIYATGSTFSQQHQRRGGGLSGSFRRYKIPSPAEIFEMINDKYISPVGGGLVGKRKTAKRDDDDRKKHHHHHHHQQSSACGFERDKTRQRAKRNRNEETRKSPREVWKREARIPSRFCSWPLQSPPPWPKGSFAESNANRAQTAVAASILFLVAERSRKVRSVILRARVDRFRAGAF